jgi:hypothetical protein
VIEHTGRRSGRRHTTPIVEQPGGFIVPLKCGPRTTWYANCGPGDCPWQGRVIPVGNPTLVSTRRAATQFPLPSRFLLWLDGTEGCVGLEDLTPGGV